MSLRYSASIRAWAHTKLIRQIVLTVTGSELKSKEIHTYPGCEDVFAVGIYPVTER
jgi:hypothetical protein